VRSTAPKSHRSGIDPSDWLSCPNRLSIAAYFRPALRTVPQPRPAVYATNHEQGYVVVAVPQRFPGPQCFRAVSDD
jgi:hypothetical protein